MYTQSILGIFPHFCGIHFLNFREEAEQLEGKAPPIDETLMLIQTFQQIQEWLDGCTG